MATIGVQHVLIKGAQAMVRYGYQRAADLGPWQYEGDWFVAQVRSVDGFRITQSPLMLEIPQPTGPPMRRSITEVTVYQGQLSGRLARIRSEP